MGKTGPGEAKEEAGESCASSGGAGETVSKEETETAEAGCTLVAKWQGKTIELPELAKSTTIGEVKVGI